MILKRKSRYVLIESSRSIDVISKHRQMLGILSTFLGESYLYESNPRVTKQYDGNVFIMRVNRGTEDKLILGLSFLKEFEGESVGFYTIKVSGTIQSLLDYADEAYGAKHKINTKKA